MIPIQIVEVREKKDLQEFLDLPWRIYAHDPFWVPPLRGSMMKLLLGIDNPLFRNGPHAFFLAKDQGRVTGRVLVGINEKLNREKGKQEGYLSLFETIDDQDTAFALFDAACGWLRERGMDTITGPVSPTNGDDMRGILVEGFNGPPVLMNSYNPPYYKGLFEACGFEKCLDLYAYYLDTAALNEERYGRVVHYAMEKYHFHIDRFDRRQLDREVRDIKAILDLAMPDTWEHLTPPSLAEIRAEFNNLCQYMDPDLVNIARSNDGRPIGFVVALPDYNQVLRHLNGRLFPIGFLKYLWYKRTINGVRIFIQFVIPGYRNKGVNSAIYHRLMLEARRKKHIYGEGSTIGEMNKESIRNVEKVGGKLYRTYRIYQKKLS